MECIVYGMYSYMPIPYKVPLPYLNIKLGSVVFFFIIGGLTLYMSHVLNWDHM